jgi:hypothetical protein
MKHLFSDIEIPTFFLTILCFLSFSVIAQTTITTASSAQSLFQEGNMKEANNQYGTLLSIEPHQIDFQYYYAVTCTADSSLREEGIERLEALVGDMESDGERLFYLAKAYHQLENFEKAIDIFSMALINADKKSEWVKEAELRLSQCEASQNLATPSISLSYSVVSEVDLDDFYRSIPTENTPYRITLVPSELRSKLDKKRGWKSPVVYTPESNVIYFSSYGNKDVAGLDIFESKILPDGSFSEPQRLPKTVNSLSDEINPVYHNESASIIFASDKASSIGGFDLFSSTVISRKGEYKSAERLPRVWNTSSNEYFLFPDSKVFMDGNLSGGWLVSDRSGHFSSTVLYKAHATSIYETPDEVIIETPLVVVDSTHEVPKIKEYMELEKVTLVHEKPIHKAELAIQVGVFSSIPDVDFLPYDTEVIIKTLPNGLIKVYAGPFVNERERSEAKAELIAFGLTDVFNSTVIKTEETVTELQPSNQLSAQPSTQDAPEGVHSTDKLPGIWYAIQIGAFSGNPDEATNEIANGNLFYELLDSGLKRWYTEANRSVEIAFEMLPRLIERGARKDAFIVKLDNGKRIKIVSMNSINTKTDAIETNVSKDFFRVRIASFVNSVPAIEAAALLHIGTLITVRSIEIGGEKVYYSSKLPLEEAKRAYELSLQEGFENARIEKFNE